jgi:SNF2 family DNA or RNA helicase
VQTAGDKVVVFSQFTEVLTLLQECLDESSFAWLRIDGSTAAARRQTILDNFAAAASVPVLLLSTKAGGQGLNITAATRVVLFDHDWNPQQDAQAEDRCHRMGQTRPVTVTRLYCGGGSIEWHMAQSSAGKLGMVHALMSLGERGSTAAAAGAGAPAGVGDDEGV